MTHNTGPAAGWTTDTITGDNFLDGARVRFATSVAPVALTGTLDFTNGLTAVTGTGTLFLTEVPVGSLIKSDAAGTWHKVTSVTDDTNLTLVVGYDATAPGSTAKRYREDYAEKPLTGTLTCTIASVLVTGTGTDLTNEVVIGDWVKLNDAKWYKVATVGAGQQMTLTTPCSFTGASAGILNLARVSSTTTIDVKTPPNSAGTVDVRVYNIINGSTAGTGIKPAAFTYTP